MSASLPPRLAASSNLALFSHGMVGRIAPTTSEETGKSRLYKVNIL